VSGDYGREINDNVMKDGVVYQRVAVGDILYFKSSTLSLPRHAEAQARMKQISDKFGIKDLVREDRMLRHEGRGAHTYTSICFSCQRECKYPY
tara:strand:- start:1488 stop:1766 length:279 start_codon:yes stop_codon:yes gene_type:complete